MGIGEHAEQLLQRHLRRVRTSAEAQLEAEVRALAADAESAWYGRVRPGRDAGRSGRSFVARVEASGDRVQAVAGNTDPAAPYIRAAGTTTPLVEELLLEPARKRLPALLRALAADIVRSR